MGDHHPTSQMKYGSIFSLLCPTWSPAAIQRLHVRYSERTLQINIHHGIRTFSFFVFLYYLEMGEKSFLPIKVTHLSKMAEAF